MKKGMLTLNQIRAFYPCKSGWKELLSHLGKTTGDDEPLSILTVLKSNGVQDALWCARTHWVENKTEYMEVINRAVQRATEATKAVATKAAATKAANTAAVAATKAANAAAYAAAATKAAATEAADDAAYAAYAATYAAAYAAEAEAAYTTSTYAAYTTSTYATAKQAETEKQKTDLIELFS